MDVSRVRTDQDDRLFALQRGMGVKERLEPGGDTGLEALHDQVPDETTARLTRR